MDKGIRPACNAKFRELLPQRAEIGNTAFRKAVMAFIMEEYGITLASAATHYNHSFQQVKLANPELVEGLGRPEDKKGGRKKKIAAVLAVDAEEAEAPPVDELDPMPEEQTVFSVLRKSDNVVIAEGLTFEAARDRVEKAKAAKKSALYWI